MANAKNTGKLPAGKLSRRELLKRSTAYAAGIAAMTSSSSEADGAVARAEYIVIGSGPGGGPVACNLAKAGHRVVLMEAGTAGTDPDLQAMMKTPILFANASADPRIAWEYYIRHYADDTQQKLDSKYVAAKGGILYPRASTIGGCGVHNALAMVYPSNSDWDYIASLTGDDSWAPGNMRTISSVWNSAVTRFQRLAVRIRRGTVSTAGKPPRWPTLRFSWRTLRFSR
jgi:choline dehydrogenase